MKKFQGLGKILSKDQLMKIMGGDPPPPACSCSCTGGATGSWTYDNGGQPSGEARQRDIDRYCSTKTGTCTNCTTP